MPALLFEIGTEEIPARFMNGALKELKKLAQDLLTENRLAFQGLNTYGTPRRLALYIENLAERQSDMVKEVKGPPKKAAFDAEGNPTKAALGFAKSQGVSIEDLEIRDVGKAEYLFAVVHEKGKETQEILPGILEKLVTSLNFPKPMRWGSEGMRFVRPIRWLVALYGDQVIDIEIAGVRSGRETQGHRFLCQQPVVLNQPEEYLEKLEQGYVVVDQKCRRELIWEQIEKEAHQVGGRVEPDEELLEEVTYLVEYPTALCGSFDEKYLQLPQEVLITPMKEHQRYFPVWSEDDGLMAQFITVRNGNKDHLDNVRAGNEKVLLARLADAEFFYQEDQKTPLKEQLEKLEKVVFQESLGTVAEKVARIKELACYIAKEASWDDKTIDLVAETANLAKADLVTLMVNEFPELQGIMGGYYAQLENYDELIAQGIREHYQPRFAGDAVPQSPTGIAVSIADKIDTIAGCFLIGLIPTGSQDPYALRRQALGICHTIIDNGLNISLSQLIAKACELYQGIVKDGEQENVQENILHFFRQRIENILEEEEGLRYDVVDAVLAVGFDNLTETKKRAQALAEFSQQPAFKNLATAFTRASNLSKNAPPLTVDEANFVEEVEKNLYEAVNKVESLVEKEIAQGDYLAALEVLSHLQEPVDKFFEDVMVMVEDTKIKDNRLALLQRVVQTTFKIADLSKLAIK